MSGRKSAFSDDWYEGADDDDLGWNDTDSEDEEEDEFERTSCGFQIIKEEDGEEPLDDSDWDDY